MGKSAIKYLLILLLYSCVPRERGDVLVERKPIIINNTDTLYVYLDVEPSMADKYEAALRSYLEVTEATGNNDGPAVKRILERCGINIPAPWCACYLHSALLDIGLGGGPDHQPAFTPRWFEDPERITYVRDKYPEDTLFEKGWIFGIYFRSLGRIGHVGVVLEDFGDGYILTIEGNTNSAGSREGNGVFIRIRHRDEIYMCADWLNNNEANAWNHRETNRSSEIYWPSPLHAEKGKREEDLVI